MVYALDIFGAAPVLVASLMTSIGFASHHSPEHHGSSESTIPTNEYLSDYLVEITNSVMNNNDGRLVINGG